MNMFARFDENPAMTLQDIQAFKRPSKKKLGKSRDKNLEKVVNMEGLLE